MTDKWIEKKFKMPHNADVFAFILEKAKDSPFNEINGNLLNPDYNEKERDATAVLEVENREIKLYWKSIDKVGAKFKDGIPIGEPDEIHFRRAGEICGGHSRQVFKDSINLINQYLKKGYNVSYLSLNAEKSVFERKSLAHISFDGRAKCTEIRYESEFEKNIAPVLENIKSSVHPFDYVAPSE